MKLLIYIVCSSLLLTSCKHQRAISQKELFDFITIEEFACEGSCPVYSFIIYSSGEASFKGKLNVIKKGQQSFQFTKKETKNLFDYLSTIQILEFQSEYKSLIADLPETVITYKEKRIIIKDIRNVPQNLAHLVIKLKKLARSTGYIN